MADIVVTENKVAATKPNSSEIFTGIAAVAITAGQSCYLNSAGKLDLTDADVLGSSICKGIALQSVGPGQAVDLLKRGPLEGFTITQAYDAPVYTSVTPGAVADAVGGAGDFSFAIGRVVPASDKDLTKILYVDIDYSHVPVAL